MVRKRQGIGAKMRARGSAGTNHMTSMRFLSHNDVLILAIVIAVVGYILGLLADVVMRDRGFGPSRNAIIIVAGGVMGAVAMVNLYPPSPRTELISSVFWGVGMATVALLVGSLVKKFVSN